jgi:hypothetical protein
MIGDLLKLFETVQSAQSDQEKADREHELETAVQAEIRSMFDDPKYPRRRRSFGAIRQRLAIFDDDPGRLTEILFRMKARRVRGDGDDALWQLPEQTPGATGSQPPRKRRRWQTVAAVLLGVGIVLGLVSANKIGPSDVYRFVASSFQSGPATRQDCLDQADGNMRKVTQCYQDFP